MGNLTELPNIRGEIREQIVHGLRVIADAIEMGIDDYDGIVVIGYYRAEEEPEILPFNISNSELSWMGNQMMNHALACHYEQGEDD